MHPPCLPTWSLNQSLCDSGLEAQLHQSNICNRGVPCGFTRLMRFSVDHQVRLSIDIRVSVLKTRHLVDTCKGRGNSRRFIGPKILGSV
jgi:hypothetical protein